MSAKTKETTEARADEVVTFYANRATTFKGVFYAQGYTVSCPRGEMTNSNFVEMTTLEIARKKAKSNRVVDIADSYTAKRTADIIAKAKGAIL